MKYYTVKEILENIDTSKMVRSDASFGGIFDNIDEDGEVEQPEGNIRLTYCDYYTWYDPSNYKHYIRVWYFDDKGVAISTNKNDSQRLYWLSYEDYDNVKSFFLSLYKNQKERIDLITDETLNFLYEDLEPYYDDTIEYFNVIK